MSEPYREFVVQGPKGWTLGFVEGFVRAKGGNGRLLDAEHEGFDCEPLREKIRELLTPGRETLHLLAPESLAPLVREAVAEAAASGRDVSLSTDRPVAGARFEFRFSIYSRAHAGRIRRLFEELPDGVQLSADSAIEEHVYPDAKGIEGYAPVHDYEMRGRGVVEGAVLGVLELYRACRDEELIQEGPLELVHAGS